MDIEAQLENQQPYKDRISSFLKDLIRLDCISAEELGDLAYIPEEKIQEALSGDYAIGIQGLTNLSQKLNFGLDALVEGKVDPLAIRNHVQGNKEYIPMKYRVAAFSKKMNVINALEFINKELGFNIKTDICRHFQITQQIYRDPEGNINVSFFKDLFSYLTARGCPEAVFSRIGENTIKTHRGSVFAKKLGASSDAKELYQFYFEELVGLIDKNNTYVITHLDDDCCIVESREKPEMLDIFETQHIGCKNRCTYRVGALSAATDYIGLPYSIVNEVECAHRGGRVCRFLIDYSYLRPNKLRQRKKEKIFKWQ